MTKEAVSTTLSPAALIATLPVYADDWLAILRMLNYAACYSPEYLAGVYAAPQASFATAGWTTRYVFPIWVDEDAININFRASCEVLEALHAAGMDVRLNVDGSVGTATLTGFTDLDNGSYKQAGFTLAGSGYHFCELQTNLTGINPLNQLIDFQVELDIINPTSLP